MAAALSWRYDWGQLVDRHLPNTTASQPKMTARTFPSLPMAASCTMRVARCWRMASMSSSQNFLLASSPSLFFVVVVVGGVLLLG